MDITDQKIKELSVSKMINEKFSKEQLVNILTGILFFVFNDDDKKVIRYLEKVSNKP